jgi:hypothetical protein
MRISDRAPREVSGRKSNTGNQELDKVRFSLGTNDFTPIYNQIEAKRPNAIIAVTVIGLSMLLPR